MSLPRTKRIKYYNPDGSEVFEEEDRWALVRAVHSTAKVKRNIHCVPNTKYQVIVPSIP